MTHPVFETFCLLDDNPAVFLQVWLTCRVRSKFGSTITCRMRSWKTCTCTKEARDVSATSTRLCRQTNAEKYQKANEVSRVQTTPAFSNCLSLSLFATQCEYEKFLRMLEIIYNLFQCLWRTFWETQVVPRNTWRFTRVQMCHVASTTRAMNALTKSSRSWRNRGLWPGAPPCTTCSENCLERGHFCVSCNAVFWKKRVKCFGVKSTVHVGFTISLSDHPGGITERKDEPLCRPVAVV